MAISAKKLTAAVCALSLLAGVCGCGRTVLTGDGSQAQPRTSDSAQSVSSASDGKFSLFYDSGESMGWWPLSTDKTAFAGSLSAASAYSIGKGSSVVQAFRDYGWGWGGQGYSSRSGSQKFDYMHFSVMGIRPTVRGSVMNPNDHPHGGGEGKAPIGRPGPVTPWGKPALGYKTRKTKNRNDKFIVKRRNDK